MKDINKDLRMRRLGNIYGENFSTGYGGNVFDTDYIAPTLKVESAGGGRVPMIVEDITEPVIVASRGRDPDNPSNREAGSHLEQRLELNDSGLSNTITSVAKDNWVLEPNQDVKIEKIGQISTEGSQCGTVVSENGLMSTITAGTHDYGMAHIQTKYRIRKLTPNECWRLMSYKDSDFKKAQAVSSNTNLYKMAGNGIARNVLVAILGQMFVGKEDVYKKFNVNDLKD